MQHLHATLKAIKKKLHPHWRIKSVVYQERCPLDVCYRGLTAHFLRETNRHRSMFHIFSMKDSGHLHVPTHTSHTISRSRHLAAVFETSRATSLVRFSDTHHSPLVGILTITFVIGLPLGFCIEV